jgi:hypothetical protein
VRTADDGSYRFDGLWVGDLEVLARHREHGELRAKLPLAAGEERRWYATLTPGTLLRGRVVDAGGDAVPDAYVSAELDPHVAGSRWYPRGTTDADGRFAFANCEPERNVRITIRRREHLFDDAVVRGVLPGPEAVWITLPPLPRGYITGTVRGAGDEIPPNVQASLRSAGANSGPILSADSASGAFRFGPCPPDDYNLSLAADGYPAIYLVGAVGADADWELGVVRFAPGGELAVRLVGEVQLPARLYVALHDERGNLLRFLAVADGSASSGPLMAGDYVLAVSGREFAATMVPFTIAVGTVTELDVPLAVGSAATLHLEGPFAADEDEPVQVVIRDAADRLVHRSAVQRSEGRYEHRVRLRPGTYRVTATWRACAASASLGIAGADVAATLRLRPR